MPVSDTSSIPAIMNEVYRLRPKKIIDLGVGFGKYGVLCREVLDATEGRVKKENWQTWIEGVEGFAAYENPAWGVYDKVAIGDIKLCYQYVTDYDLVLLIDVLEHMDKTAAQCILSTLAHNNRNIIASVPIGHCPQEAVFGNEFERHVATWTGAADFAQYKYHAIHVGVCFIASIRGVVPTTNMPGVIKWPTQ